MCRNALEEASVLIMTYANARSSGLGMIVPSTLVRLSTIAQVSTIYSILRWIHLALLVRWVVLTLEAVE